MNISPNRYSINIYFVSDIMFSAEYIMVKKIIMAPTLKELIPINASSSKPTRTENLLGSNHEIDKKINTQKSDLMIVRKK